MAFVNYKNVSLINDVLLPTFQPCLKNHDNLRVKFYSSYSIMLERMIKAAYVTRIYAYSRNKKKYLFISSRQKNANSRKRLLIPRFVMFVSFFRLSLTNSQVVHCQTNVDCFPFVSGISTLASCGEVDALPELPAQDEERLQRAARLLQQRLVLRQWLMDHGLHNYYQK